MLLLLITTREENGGHCNRLALTALTQTAAAELRIFFGETKLKSNVSPVCVCVCFNRITSIFNQFFVFSVLFRQSRRLVIELLFR